MNARVHLGIDARVNNKICNYRLNISEGIRRFFIRSLSSLVITGRTVMVRVFKYNECD
jgi:hypothetical protein